MNKFFHLLAISVVGAIVSSQALSTTAQCGFHGAREVSGASLHIAESSSFDSYRYIWIDEIHLQGSTGILKDSDRNHLRRLIKDSIEQQWQERLGWRSAATAGEAVASLSVALDTVSTEDGAVHVHANLRDSLTGQQLLTQCGRELHLEIPTEEKTQKLAWQAVQQEVSHWGAGLGTHIMAVY